LNAKVKAPVLTYLQMLLEYWIPTTVNAATMLPGERLIDRMADDGTRITLVMVDDTLPRKLACSALVPTTLLKSPMKEKVTR
jgi:hypothetical protein